MSGVQFDILDTPPSDSEMLDGQSVIVSGAGELRRHTKIDTRYDSCFDADVIPMVACLQT